MALSGSNISYFLYSNRQKAQRVSRENEIKKILLSATPLSPLLFSSTTLSSTLNVWSCVLK